MTRAVCDTNVVVSALVFSGQLDWLRDAWRSRILVPLVSEMTATELLKVLTYPKFQLDDEDRRELLGDYLPFAEVIRIPDPPPDVPEPSDPDDRMFLELAIVGNADMVITGDPALLAIADDFDRPVLAPAAARHHLRP